MPSYKVHPTKGWRLGKLPVKKDARTLQLKKYLVTLPTPPQVIDHASRLPSNIGMMLNDQYGICGIAAPGHMIQSWTMYANRGMLTIPDADLLKAYMAITGGQDTGTFLLDDLNYWRKTGIGGEHIEAFVQADVDLTQTGLITQYFGAPYIGMSLPDVNTFGPWTTVTGSPNPNNGHAVAILAIDYLKRLLRVATWGEIWDMSFDWFMAYCDEQYAVLDDIELLIDTGKSPEGFDWTALQDDLNHIGDPVTPGPGPTPPPGPGPVTPPKPWWSCGMAALTVATGTVTALVFMVLHWLH